MLIVGSCGLTALLAGLWVLPPSLAPSVPRAADAIAAELPATLPAAILVFIAAAMNIGTAGLLIQRLLPTTGQSLSTLLLAAFGSAVLLDVALLYVLGGLGFFSRPVLIVIHVGLVALALPGRQRVRRPVVGALRPHLGWGLVALVWAAPVLLQLASPVVPFMDVLPNHVAPVEHLRTFGHFDPLTTSPSPIYGASRLSLGFIGLLGTITTLSDLPAAQAISAFIVVEVAFVAVAVAALARSAGGRYAVFWILIAFAMTQPFARLADDRSRIVAIPIIAWTLIELLRATRHGAAPTPIAWAIGIGLGATLLVHAVIGTFLVLVVLVAVALSPQRHRSLMPALAMAAILATPQAAVMVGIPVPSSLGVIVFPAAVGASLVIARMTSVGLALGWVVRIALVVPIAVAVAQAGVVVPALVRWLSAFAPAVPILGLTGLAGLMWVRPSARWMLIAMLGIGVAAGTVANLVPADTDSLLWQSVRYEVPKEVHTWLPIALAISSAAFLANFVRRMSSAGWLRQAGSLGVLGVWLAVAALPLRPEPIGGLHVGERHLSENLAIQLGYAETGFWTGYPDTRWVVDGNQLQVLAAIRQEIAAGRITSTSRLLHVSRTYQQWGSIPVGVFTGVVETVVSPDSQVTIHSVGGRLVPLESLRAELAADYDYLLIEWRDIPPDLAQLVGGFDPIFANDGAQLLRRHAPLAAAGVAS